MKVQKTILVDAEEIKLWQLKHPNESFSAWVRHCIKLDVLPETEEEKQQNHTLDEVPKLPTPLKESDAATMDPLEIPDRNMAEQRAREILSHFKQSQTKTEANVEKFLARWDAHHKEV